MIAALLKRRTAGAAIPLQPGDSVFMTDLKASLLNQVAPGSRLILQLIGVVLCVGLGWAALARVEQITPGEGLVVSQSREQVIQSLEGGILAQMHVSEGDIVEQGAPLLRIDPTRAESSYRESLSKVLGLRAAISRLRAEAYQQPLRFDEQVSAETDLVAQETQAFKARKRALDNSLDALQRSHRLSLHEIRLVEPLAAKGLLSEVELLRMRRQANEIHGQIIERGNRYQAEASAELARLELELAQASEHLVGRSDVVERTTLFAPLRGTVKNIRSHTIGGVIQPGAPILELVPLEDQLLVEGRIRPADIAFLQVGLPVMVKITAYDYSIYGGLEGVLEHISPSTLKDDQRAAAGRPDDSYYRVLVLTRSNALQAAGRNLPIIPGMLASVEIRTGEKTILEYLLKPVLKAREAFRER